MNIYPHIFALKVYASRIDTQEYKHTEARYTSQAGLTVAGLVDGARFWEESRVHCSTKCVNPGRQVQLHHVEPELFILSTRSWGRVLAHFFVERKSALEIFSADLIVAPHPCC